MWGLRCKMLSTKHMQSRPSYCQVWYLPADQAPVLLCLNFLPLAIRLSGVGRQQLDPLDLHDLVNQALCACAQ